MVETVISQGCKWLLGANEMSAMKREVRSQQGILVLHRDGDEASGVGGGQARCILRTWC
jgi:hypothetical protein